MMWYRMLFLNRKTFSVASAGAFLLLTVSAVLMAVTGQLSFFTAACYLLTFLLCAGLTAAWKKEDMIRISGLVGGILLVELCRYTYVSEQYLSIGVDAIVGQGLIQCMILSTSLMVCFIILMVAYNHFTIYFGKRSGRTKLIVNQFSICVLFLCFLLLTVERWMVAGQFLSKTAGALNCLADLCLFFVIACCELYLTVDGQILAADHRRE